MPLHWKTRVEDPAMSYAKPKLILFFAVITVSITEPRHIIIQIIYFKDFYVSLKVHLGSVLVNN